MYIEINKTLRKQNFVDQKIIYMRYLRYTYNLITVINYVITYRMTRAVLYNSLFQETSYWFTGILISFEKKLTIVPTYIMLLLPLGTCIISCNKCMRELW